MSRLERPIEGRVLGGPEWLSLPMAVGGAVFAMEWMGAELLGVPERPPAAGLGLLAMILGLLVAVRCRWVTAVRFVAALVPTVLLVVCLRERFCGYELPLGPLAAAVGTALEWLGIGRFDGGSAVLLEHQDGLYRVLLQPELFGLRGLLGSLVLWMVFSASVRRGRRLALAAICAHGVAAVVICLLGLAVVRGEADLVERGFPTWFRGWSPVAPALLASVMSMRLWAWTGASLEHGPAKGVAGRVAGATVAARWSAVVALAWIPLGLEARVPDESSPSRVVVDDRFIGEWGPAARLLDDEWYGDFSTYGFASAVEFLGHEFPVVVNTTKPYTDEYLKDFDVLLMRTPVLDLPSAEVEAIRRFVRRGGGILVVGDHTNLMRMNDRLNALVEGSGIRFRSDSTMTADVGSFSFWRRARLSNVHPVCASVDQIEMMTGCSFELSYPATSVMSLAGQTSEIADWANGSFFGSLAATPHTQQGDLSLCAASRLGLGRVVAFGDSTILSSFALFSYDREAWLRDSVAWLSGSPHPSRRWLRWLGLAGTLSAIGLAWLTRGRWAVHGLLLVLLGQLASPLAVFDGPSDGSHEGAHRAPRIGVLIEGVDMRIPPVLGTSPNIDTDWSYDTWYAAISRSGWFPDDRRMTDGIDDIERIWIMNPTLAPTAEFEGRLRDLLARGGTVLVGMRTDRFYLEALRAYTRLAGGDVSFDGQDLVQVSRPFAPSADPAWGSTVLEAPVGEGRFLIVPNSERFSRARMGHCFSLPGVSQRTVYREIVVLSGGECNVVPSRRTFLIE